MIKNFTLLFVICILAFTTTMLGQSSGDYRSVADGNWSSLSIWEIYDGGTSSWIPATVVPTGSEKISIQSSDTVTVDIALSNVSGYIYCQGGLSIGATGSLAFSTGIYEHARNAGTIPTATWGVGSTCLITGSTSVAPSNGSQNYYNYTWNCAGQTTNLHVGWLGNTIYGNVTCLAPAASQFRMTSSAGTNQTITVKGNVIVDGGYLSLSGSSGAANYKVIVEGNITVANGKFSLVAGSGGLAVWYLYGDLNLTSSGAQFITPSNKTAGTKLVFAKKDGLQYFNNNGGKINDQSVYFDVDSNATLQLNSPLTVNKDLNLVDGVVVSTSTNLLTISSTGNITSSNSSFVDGPLAMVVAATNATKTFTVGKGTAYRPLTLTVNHLDATATTYTAELFNTAPVARILPSTLQSVSSVRYINLIKGTGAELSPTLGATAQLYYDTDDGISDAALTRVAKDDGAGNWENLGGSGTAMPTGSITSNAFFTLGASTDFVIAKSNPDVVVVVPTVTTDPVTDISTTTATSGGNVTNNGGAAVTERGVCWNTTGSPTFTDSKTTDGNGNGTFISSIAGLTAGATYHLRAYATNSTGTGYGEEIVFVALSELVVPTVTSAAVTNIVYKNATGGGEVTLWGGTPVTERGICWNTTGNPTIADEYTTSGSGTGTFIANMGGLSLSTNYYVRAYAKNNTGIGYGDQVSFRTPDPAPTIIKIVAQDGSGDYNTVQAAFDAVTPNYTGKWYIYVKNGTYYEKLILAAGKINVVLVGESKENTILTYDDYSGKNANSSGTSTSYSVAIDADDFEAQNITFRNTATAAQAVALRTNGDRQEYYNCNILGFQDTYYTWGGSRAHRVYTQKCLIQGSVDFIFGRDIVVFDSCTINCNRNNGTLTAANTDAGYLYGYVFNNCTISTDVTGFDGFAINNFYLGRPWQSSPRTVFINCYEPANLNAEGWQQWGATKPGLYAEYNCFGPGSGYSTRFSTWTADVKPTVSQLTSEEAAAYTLANIYAKNTSNAPYGDNWLPSKEPIDYSIIPVELNSFSATVQNDKVVLKWKTATETNNSGWSVERSKDNAEWKSITFVPGAGTTTLIKEYSYTDKNLQSGTYNYRLKQIDLDGTFEYSSIQTAKVEMIPQEYSLKNFPNPFNPSTTIKYALPKDSKVQIIIYNTLGEKVANVVDLQQEAGVYETTFDAGNLTSGIYLYQLITDEKVLTEKMMLVK